MSKVHAALLSFNSGEVSKLALARVDVEAMRLAAECQVNFLPSVLGPMMLRPGLRHLGSTASNNTPRYVPFIFGASDTALIELTASLLRVWIDDAVVTRGSVSSAVTSGDFSASTGWTLTASSGSSAAIGSGVLDLAAVRGGQASAAQQVTVAGGDQNDEHALRIVVTRGIVLFRCGSTSGGEEYIPQTALGVGTHSLAFTPTGDFHVTLINRSTRVARIDSITVEAAGVMSIATSWTASELPLIRYTQSGDIVYLACEGIKPFKIERRADRSWSLVEYRSETGPFEAGPADPTITLGSTAGTEGNVTIAATRPFWTSAHVGKLFRLETPGRVATYKLGGIDSFTEALKITGVGTDRAWAYVIAGTWSGTITVMRSYEGPDSGFFNFTTHTANVGTTTITDGLNNVDVWVRLGFIGAQYVSGHAEVSLLFAGGGQAGVVRVLSITSTTQAACEVIAPLSSLNGTPIWQQSEWGDDTYWPGAIAFHDGRLWWAGLDRLVASVSDDYESFDPDTEGDSGPIQRTVGYGPIDYINWLLPITRLIVGREMSETSVRSSAFDEPLTPTNFTLKDCSTQGSAQVGAVKIDTRGVFVEKSERRAYELAYSVEIQDFRARDLTHLAPHVFGTDGVAVVAVQRQPETVIHFVRGDGQVALLVQSAEDQVECWHRFQTLGVVEDVIVLPGAQEDAVYYVVKRTINSSTVRFLEKFALRTQCQGGSLSRSLDSHLAISQASSTTISGLSHLQGELVYVWANGKDLGSYTVAAGAITVSEAVTTAIVGLGGVSFSYDSSTAAASVTCAAKYNGYPCEVFASGPNGGELKYVGTVTVASGVATLPNGRSAKKIKAYLGFYGLFRSAKLAYGAQMGTALAQKKKIDSLGLILFDTHYQGLSYGSSIDNLQPLPLVEGGVDTASDTVWPEFDRPMTGLSGSWDTDSRLHLVAQAPKPVTVAAAIVAVTTSESR